MDEKIEIQVNNPSEISEEKIERKRLEEEIISLEEYVAISSKILEKYENKLREYEKDSKGFDEHPLNKVSEIIERIVKSFPAEPVETREIVQKLIFVDIEYIDNKENLKQIDNETLEVLEEKTNNWIKLITMKGFTNDIEKHFQKEDLKNIDHMWKNPLTNLKAGIDLIRDAKGLEEPE